MRHKEGNKGKDIIEAAITCFAKKGYHHTKIIDIAVLANVAVGSVYVYYKDKEDILLKIFKNLWDSIYFKISELSKNSNLSPEKMIAAMIDDLFDAFIENPNIAIVFVNEQPQIAKISRTFYNKLYERYLDIGEEFIKKGIEKKIFSQEFNIKTFRIFIFGAIRHLIHHWAESNGKVSLSKIKEDVKYLVKNGILVR
ncbi:MAG: TetR/AcrR family transcriptional regulator [Ignavibacteriales bacterium]|nr:TetR/AcrR family transcriptional regulator [Ignavibacteriales bacterium]